MIKKVLKFGNELSKNEMRKITGGLRHCSVEFDCPQNECCNGKWCEPALDTPPGTWCYELQP